MKEEQPKKFGFLQMCADRRFHTEVEEKFRAKTNLGRNDYWIEARAGGAPAIKDRTTADYAHNRGAKYMGWAAHGSTCGGFKEANDEEMRKKLEETIVERRKRYPDASHYRIFSVELISGETETTIEEVIQDTG